MDHYSAENALKRLIEGNKQYTELNEICYENLDNVRNQTFEIQRPFAAIITCADSRIPAELIFNQNIGDLFVIRIAGNIINDEIIGSLEFAIDYLKINLIVLMGHSNCGAVKAALGEENYPEHLQKIVKKIKKNIKKIETSDDNAYENAIEENVRTSINQVEKHFHNREGLKIVGAHYCLKSGKVELLEQ